MESIQHNPQHISPPIIAMAIQPQPPRKTNGQRRETQTPHQCQDVVEDRDGACQDKRNGRHTNRTRQPSPPVHYRVRLQMARVAQDSHEEVFGCDVYVETAADDQAREGDPVGDPLDGFAGAAEGWGGDPLAAPGVDY